MKLVKYLTTFSEKKRLLEIKQTDHNNTAFIQELTRYPALFKAVLNILGKEEQKSLLTTVFPNGNLLLHDAANDASSLQHLFKLYQTCQKAIPILETTSSGDNVLHTASSCHNSINKLFTKMNENKRQTAIVAKNLKGVTPLHRAAPFLRSIPMLMNALATDEDRLELVLMPDLEGRTPLYEAIPYANQGAVKTMIELLHPEQRNKAIASIIHDLSRIKPECMPSILEMAPKPDRAQLILTPDNSNKTPIEYVLANQTHYEANQLIYRLPELASIQVLLSLLSNEIMLWDNLDEFSQEVFLRDFPIMHAFVDIKNSLSSYLDPKALSEALTPRKEDRCIGDILQRMLPKSSGLFEDTNSTLFKVFCTLNKKYNDTPLEAKVLPEVPHMQEKSI